MKTITNILIALSIILYTGFFMYIGYQNSEETIRQGNDLESLQKQVINLEESHIRFLETWKEWQVANDRFDEALLKGIKTGDDSLYKEIEKLKSFDYIVVERLKSISEAHRTLINAITGLSSTNFVEKAVDNAK